MTQTDWTLNQVVYLRNTNDNNIVKTNIKCLGLHSVIVEYLNLEFYTGIDTADGELLAVGDEPFVLYNTIESATLGTTRIETLRRIYDINLYNIPTRVLRTILTILEEQNV